ncbi:conjugal transfer protein TraG [Faecalibacterium sp. An77]|uniref:conjugal transfer protein TraG n=1 Tax=Faecalibacterium sp. An77 TaxID=1965655 RepID=UPI000B38C502|nr:conjugal transfer protein TraG [Faecalibacterium sp. An77]OUN33351.1 conjugal transfer protein TraG [Faecalibacterium sp. An77]
MNQNTKRLVIPNLPYILMGLYATNLGRAWRVAAGTDMTEKMQSLMAVLPDVLGHIIPSFHPLDLLVGLCCGAGLRLAVYLKGKNAKKYRHGSEYGSARWSA